MKRILLLAMALGLLTSCSHSILVKECLEVADSDKFVCRTLKPLE